MATSLMHALYLSCLPHAFPSALVSEALSCLRSTPRTNGLTWGSIKAQLTRFKEFTNKDLWVLVLIWLSSGLNTHPMVHIYNTKQTNNKQTNKPFHTRRLSWKMNFRLCVPVVIPDLGCSEAMQMPASLGILPQATWFVFRLHTLL